MLRRPRRWLDNIAWAVLDLSGSYRAAFDTALRRRGTCQQFQSGEAADMAVENAAKALAVLEGVKAKTLWSHDVGTIVGEFEDEDTDALRSLMAVAPELVKSPDYISMWRTRGAYSSPTEGMTVQEVASPAFTRSIALIACDMAEYVADAAQPRISDRQAVADVRRWAVTVRDLLSRYDIATGEPSA